MRLGEGNFALPHPRDNTVQRFQIVDIHSIVYTAMASIFEGDSRALLVYFFSQTL